MKCFARYIIFWQKKYTLIGYRAIVGNNGKILLINEEDIYNKKSHHYIQRLSLKGTLLKSPHCGWLNKLLNWLSLLIVEQQGLNLLYLNINCFLSALSFLISLLHGLLLRKSLSYHWNDNRHRRRWRKWNSDVWCGRWRRCGCCRRDVRRFVCRIPCRLHCDDVIHLLGLNLVISDLKTCEMPDVFDCEF